MRCDDCGRAFGDGDACQSCGFKPEPPSKVAQLAAVAAVRETLKNARKKERHGRP